MIRLLPRSGLRRLTLVLVLLLGPPALADRVSDLPARWQARLQPLPEADISGAEAAARSALEQARAALGELLADPGSSDRQVADAFGQLGNLYQLYQVHTLAAVCYENARILDPENIRWPYYAGYLALEDGRLRQALADLQQAQRLNPDYPTLPLRLGQTWYELNEAQQARPLLEQAVTRPGLRAAASYYLGQMALQRRDYAAARRYFEDVLAADPQASRAHYPLARAFRGLGEAAPARQHLALRGDRMPAVEDPLIGELNALRQGARPYYVKALEAVEQGRYEQAADLFREGLKRDPENPNARISLARALWLSGRPDQAREQLQAVLAKQPDQSLALFLLAVLSDLEGDGEAAVRGYERVLERDPGHAGAHFFLANRLLKQGRYRAASRAYEAVLQSGAENPFAGLYRLVALHRAGTPDRQLMPQLERELQRQGGFQALEYARIRLLALSADPQVRDPEAAVGLARELVAKAPFPPYLELLALALAAAGDWDRAEAVLGPAAAGMPGAGFGPMPARPSPLREMIGDRRLPAEPWPISDPLLQPGPVDAMAVFREYPAAVPF